MVNYLNYYDDYDDTDLDLMDAYSKMQSFNGDTNSDGSGGGGGFYYRPIDYAIDANEQLGKTMQGVMPAIPIAMNILQNRTPPIMSTVSRAADVVAGNANNQDDIRQKANEAYNKYVSSKNPLLERFGADEATRKADELYNKFKNYKSPLIERLEGKSPYDYLYKDLAKRGVNGAEGLPYSTQKMIINQIKADEKASRLAQATNALEDSYTFGKFKLASIPPHTGRISIPVANPGFESIRINPNDAPTRQNLLHRLYDKFYQSVHPEQYAESNYPIYGTSLNDSYPAKVKEIEPITKFLMDEVNNGRISAEEADVIMNNVFKNRNGVGYKAISTILNRIQGSRLE